MLRKVQHVHDFKLIGYWDNKSDRVMESTGYMQMKHLA
jgi:hypothetical protein